MSKERGRGDLGYGCLLIWTVSYAEFHTRPNLLARLARPVARCLAWIGLSSYGIYIWHLEGGRLPAMAILSWLQIAPGSCMYLVGMAIHLFCSILAGYLATRLIEHPVLRLRDRLFPRKSEKVVNRPENAGMSNGNKLIVVRSS